VSPRDRRSIGAAGLYLVCCLAAGCFVLLRLVGGAIDTDIQNLLPAGAIDPVERAAMVQAGGVASSRVAILVSAPDPDKAEAAAADLRRRLTASGVYVDSAVDGEQTGRWLFANRNALLCDATPDRFDAAQARNAAQASLAAIYAPMAPLDANLLRRDPFLSTLRLSGCLLPANRIGQTAGSVLVSGRLAGSAYRVDTQDRFIATVNRWLKDQAPNGISAARAGAAFHAARAAARARGDMSTIGLVSTAAILALLLAVFRRPAVIPISLLVVAGGYVGSLAATLLVFPTAHILVFVFGAAFVGVTSDYAIYYLSTGPQTGWADADARKRLIFRSVTVCMATSAIGFACLAVFQVALFRQLAVFAVGGLISAWACAFTVLPLLDRRGPSGRREAWLAAWRRAETFADRLKWTRRGAAMAVGALIVAAGIGALRFATLDDIRKFQPPASDIAADEAKVKAIVGPGMSPDFLLSSGPTLEVAKAREAQVLARLSPAALNETLAISRLDPTPERRAANAERLRSLLIGPHLAERAALLGMTLDPYAAGGAVALPRWLSDLEGRADDVHFVLAPVGEGAAGEAARAAAQTPGVVYVDPVAAYTRAFAAYRRAAAQAVAAAFVGVGLVLLAIYRTPRALAILAAPLVGALGGAVVSAALGVPISFFSLMGMFVIAGTGADYSILQWDWARSGAAAKSRLPILITAMTAILSMGALSLSTTHPVRSFGIVVAAGLTIAYACSSIARRAGVFAPK
jgi:predicted exporter